MSGRYHPRVSTWWWLHRWGHLRFILRELTSVAVAAWVVITLWQLCALDSGPAAYAEFQARLRTPWLLALNLVSFVFVLFHAVTWFNLAPAAMVVRVGGKRVPAALIAASNYAAWAAASAFVAWFLLRG